MLLIEKSYHIVATQISNVSYLERVTKRLAGRWITSSGYILTCTEISSTQLSCDGVKVTINGGKIVWENPNTVGTINDFNQIDWERPSGGFFWKREGMIN